MHLVKRACKIPRDFVGDRVDLAKVVEEEHVVSWKQVISETPATRQHKQIAPQHDLFQLATSASTQSVDARLNGLGFIRLLVMLLIWVMTMVGPLPQEF